MMKEEFDFDKVGKQMPYKVPAGFFDSVTKSTLAAAENIEGNKQQPRPVLWRVLSVAASVAAMLLVGYFIYSAKPGKPQQEQTIADAATPKATTPDSLVLLPAPAPAVATQVAPQQVPAPDVKTAKAPGPPHEQQLAQTKEPETLEEILASISDEELLQLTAIASAEEYVIDQTIY